VVVCEVVEEAEAEVFGGWNVTVLNEPVQVGEEETQQYCGDRFEHLKQHRQPAPSEIELNPTAISDGVICAYLEA